MSAKFLLPCTCGENLRVGRAQSGLTVSCTCGLEWEVPPQRGLDQLEPAEAVIEPAQKRAWGPAQAMMALGILIAISSGGWAGYRYVLLPEANPFSVNSDANRAVFDRMTLTQTFEYWDLSRHDIESDTDPVTELAGQRAGFYKLNYRDYRRWTWFFTALAVAGVVLAISGPLLFPSRTRKRAR